MAKNSEIVTHYVPLNCEQINLIEGRYSPSMVKSFNNDVFIMWERALFQRAASVIDFKNLPDTWSGAVFDFLTYCLYKWGFVGVFETTENGLIFQPGTLEGFNVYYQPVNFKVNNPALSQKEDVKNYKIGDNCELIKLTPDYFGIWEIITYYAEKLATLDNAINMSIINNKFAFMIAGKNKAAGEAFKKMLDKVNAGEPAVIYDSKLLNDQRDKTEPWQSWTREHLKENYLTTMQLADFNTILHNFDKEIGIPTLPVEKKERMITDEAQSTAIDAISRSEIWLRTLEESLKLVNNHFNLNISVERHFKQEVTADESVKDNPQRDV